MSSSNTSATSGASRRSSSDSVRGLVPNKPMAEVSKSDVASRKAKRNVQKKDAAEKRKLKREQKAAAQAAEESSSESERASSADAEDSRAGSVDPSGSESEGKSRSASPEPATPTSKAEAEEDTEASDEDPAEEEEEADEDEEPIKADQADKTAPKKYGSLKNADEEYQAREYGCEFCGKRYKIKGHLTRHHNDSICGKTRKAAEAEGKEVPKLADAPVKKAPVTKEKPKCPRCHKEYSTQVSCDRHLKEWCKDCDQCLEAGTKCDRNHPNCNACIAAGRSCAYYKPDTTKKQRGKATPAPKPAPAPASKDPEPNDDEDMQEASSSDESDTPIQPPPKSMKLSAGQRKAAKKPVSVAQVEVEAEEQMVADEGRTEFDSLFDGTRIEEPAQKTPKASKACKKAKTTRKADKIPPPSAVASDLGSPNDAGTTIDPTEERSAIELESNIDVNQMEWETLCIFNLQKQMKVEAEARRIAARESAKLHAMFQEFTEARELHQKRKRSTPVEAEEPEQPKVSAKRLRRSEIRDNINVLPAGASPMRGKTATPSTRRRAQTPKVVRDHAFKNLSPPTMMGDNTYALMAEGDDAFDALSSPTRMNNGDGEDVEMSDE